MSENENNFESLRQLLALKKHEVPPPGYFDRFPNRVVNQIQSPNQFTESQRFFLMVPWLFRFLLEMQARPALTGSIATGVFVLLAAGLIIAGRPDSQANSPSNLLAPVSVDGSLAMSQALAPADLMASISNTADSSPEGLAISTNLSLQPVASMFGHPNSLVQPASFTGN